MSADRPRPAPPPRPAAASPSAAPAVHRPHLGAALSFAALGGGALAGCKSQSTAAPSAPAAAAASGAQAASAFDAAAARHALSRLAFGPRPGEVAALTQAGFEPWLSAQLNPQALDDSAADARLAEYRSSLSPAQQIRAFKLLRSKQRQRDMDELDPEDAELPTTRREFRDLVARGQMLQLGRIVESKRQLLEVVTDFWSSHFNVYARKGLIRFLTADYVETTIRKYALGRFEELLLATATHPAMLIYLDNARSVKTPAPGSRAARRGRGLNENYARELLELHTLGVDGGYSQQDVVEVARVLTGWSVEQGGAGGADSERPGFRFRKRQHDTGAKLILGHKFPEGKYQEEGERLLRLLARHPATAAHISRKLCERLVSDQPPTACVAAARDAYLNSQGDIAQVIRAITEHPSFWAVARRGAKLKAPLELVASAVRALDGHVDGSTELGGTLAGLGQPIFQYATPDGYPETGDAWLGPGQALQRMRFGVQLAAGQVRGATLNLDAALPLADDAEKTVRQIDQVFFNAGLEPAARSAIQSELAGLPNSRQLRAHAVAFAVGGPDYQRQ